ncbi:proteasome adapter and scaffold protein ECM29 isoform X1 [Tripterygium wilfordii]|uniref:proteasome adapter and scaffold protein ECM29 isoform X1 n=1 Tax=Tripterygium wilfordii TaxID=458696 RepID=UPI0018F80387|nr:proteasome adapter and scaffold protein ECM29 isoform X1 [Tripterygium wilfordii]
MAESTSTSSLPAKSDAEIEEILDRMLTRLALCDDSKLEPLLSKLLPYTISSLSSQSTLIRKKVLEILNHVNKRVKHWPDIGLPLSELWTLFIDANTTQMVKNFCIVYIEMAFERVSMKEKENLAPTLLVNISKISPQHQEIILRIVSKVMSECHASCIEDEVAAKYRSINGSRDCELFVEFCLDTILYQLPPQSGGCPPGLSISQSNRVTGKHQLTSDMLLKMKLGILNVIESMELPPEHIYTLYVAACADCQEAVIKMGEELLKKKASAANLDDLNLINRLFLLFNGTTGAENVTPESRVSPGNAVLKAKLMSIFCRSITAANNFPSTLQCIFGCIFGIGTTSRLKQLGLEFTVWIFKHAKIEQLKLMGPVILNGIVKLLDGGLNSEADALARETKTFCFQAIGLLAQRLPQLFRDKIDMAVRLFDALKLEAPSLRFIVQEATNSLAAAYKEAPSTVLIELERILLNNSQVEESEVRFCAMRWATSLFDLQHCPSRFICMLGAADTKLDIREMALEGLFPSREESRNSGEKLRPKYPKLAEILEYILKQEPRFLDSTEMREQKLLFSSKMYMAMIKFLLKCFNSEVEQNHSVGRSSEFVSSVEKMCFLLEHAMAYEGSSELHAIASKSLITLGSHFPEMIASHYAPRVSWLKPLLSHMDSETRESAARLLGLSSSALSTPALSSLICELVSSISGSHNKRFEAQHGTICAIGYVAADCVSRIPGIPETLFQSIVNCLIEVVNSETAVLASVAMQALGHIGLRTPIPPVVNGSGSVEILAVLREKLTKLLSGDDIKAIQKIVISLGHICVNETSSSLLNISLDLIFGLCRSKVEDILFAAGEALSFLWGGVPVTADVILKTNYTTLAMTSNFLMDDLNLCLSKYSTNMRNEAIGDHYLMVRHAITRKLFDVLLYSNRKEERCAGTVWLLSLTMYCGHHPSIQQMLPEIQEAFSHLLGEQNELTQELASQGMSIVYELGDESMKKNLVDALVGTLTGSGKRKRAIKLVEDSEVFQEGAIGDGLSGGKLSTYKELCSLANEMGQPDLIYKFMDLANHQASLNSKRGAAFGFSKIAKQAGDALQPHLRSLIPRLIRYQYDPDKNVQDAMAHIWKSLVADPKRTIDEQLDYIIDDLVVQCGSRLWRSREASCLALADIIQGRKFDQVGKHLKKLWIAAFRAMDDIKETVRNAGDKLCRSVTSLTIRLCDVTLTETSDASQAMSIVLPFLLAEGILSKVDSVRKASIGVVMKLAKGAGIALRPHLPDLVCCMLECLSSLEDQGLNYVELHAANVGIQTEKLENLRVSIAKGSPMWETLDLCINVIDNESLDLLVPRLANLVRSAVGLNTRVGVASFISLLVQKVSVDIKPFTSMLLRLLFPVAKDERSTTAKRAFASACAMVLKHASTSQAQKLIEDSAALHLGDRNAQISCAILLKSYSFVASDILSGHHATVVPVIFISRFEDDKYVSGLFEELWEENTSGDRVTLQLYLGEIVTLICEGMISSSWARKRKSAEAIFKLSEVLGESLSSYHKVLLDCLTKEVPGRLWEGKEALLNALGALSKSCHKAISAEDPTAPTFILGLVSSACTRKVKKYREAAFVCLKEVIGAFGDPEFFNLVFPLILEMCNMVSPKLGPATVGSEASKAESDDTEDSSVPLDKILECLTSCIHIAHARDILEHKKNLMHVLLVPLSPGFQWSVKMLAFSSFKELSQRLQSMLDDSQEVSLDTSIADLVQELFHSVSPKLVECISTLKIAQVHVGASECLLEVTKLFGQLPFEHRTKAEFNGELVHLYEVEKNEVAKSLLKRCIDTLENLMQEDAQST